jgi:hypothetical protein
VAVEVPLDHLRELWPEFWSAARTGERMRLHTVQRRKFLRLSRHVVGRGTVPRFSAATRRGQRGLGYGTAIETPASEVQRILGSTSWKIVDTGRGLRRWQIDLYWGEDEPLGSGRLMARPRGTEFEYAYSEAKVR